MHQWTEHTEPPGPLPLFTCPGMRCSKGSPGLRPNSWPIEARHLSLPIWPIEVLCPLPSSKNMSFWSTKAPSTSSSLLKRRRWLPFWVLSFVNHLSHLRLLPSPRRLQARKLSRRFRPLDHGRETNFLGLMRLTSSYIGIHKTLTSDSTLFISLRRYSSHQLCKLWWRVAPLSACHLARTRQPVFPEGPWVLKTGKESVILKFP